MQTTRFVDHESVEVLVVHAGHQVLHKPVVRVLVKERGVVALVDVAALAEEILDRGAFGLDEFWK